MNALAIASFDEVNEGVAPAREAHELLRKTLGLSKYPSLIGSPTRSERAWREVTSPLPSLSSASRIPPWAS